MTWKNNFFCASQVVLLICVFETGYSQQYVAASEVQSDAYARGQFKIDSLKRLLTHHVDTVEYELLFDMVREYGNVLEENESALYHITQAHKLANNLNDTVRVIQSGRATGQLLIRLSRYVEGEKILLKMLPLAVEHKVKRETGQILSSLAITYSEMAFYDKALDYNLKALRIREEMGDMMEIGLSLNNLGVLYYKLSNFTTAILYFKRSLMIRQKLEDNYDLDRLLINLSLSYINKSINRTGTKNDLDSASRLLGDVIRLCKQGCSKQILTELYFAKGKIEKTFDRSRLAKDNYLLSYKLAYEIGNTRFQIENLIELTEIEILRSHLLKALRYLKLAESIDDGTFNEVRLQIYQQFITLYKYSGEYKTQALYQRKYIQLRDSIYGEELARNLMVIQAEYEQRENKARIELQDKELLLKENVIDHQTTINYLAAASSFLLIVLMTLLYRYNRRRMKANLLLELKVKQRTFELEKSYEAIQKGYNEESYFLTRAIKELEKNLVSVESLCNQMIQHKPRLKNIVAKITYTANSLSDIVMTFNDDK